MTLGLKVLWNDEIVTVIGVEHKSSFGDLVMIEHNNKIKIVNSNFLKKIENRK